MLNEYLVIQVYWLNINKSKNNDTSKRQLLPLLLIFLFKSVCPTNRTFCSA